MTVRVGINGFGRIGRTFERVLLDRAPTVGIEVVAVNEPNADAETLAFLLEHDSVAGVLATSVEATERGLRVAGRTPLSPDASNPVRSRGQTTTSTLSSKRAGGSDPVPRRPPTSMLGRVESWCRRPAGTST